MTGRSPTRGSGFMLPPPLSAKCPKLTKTAFDQRASTSAAQQSDVDTIRMTEF
jgi:hypothetical protein